MGNPLFGIDIAGVVKSSFAGQLLSGVLTQVEPGVRSGDITAGRTQVLTEHTFEGVYDDYKEEEIDGTTVKAGDRRVIVIAGTLPDTVIPKANWLVKLEGLTTRVVYVTRDPAAATYTLQVRKP